MDSILLTGGVMVWVLYAPEEGGSAQILNTWIPFQMKWDLPENWDYKDIYLGQLEELAVRFQLSRYRVYTADELAGAVHRAILQSEGVLPSVSGMESSGECF